MKIVERAIPVSNLEIIQDNFMITARNVAYNYMLLMNIKVKINKHGNQLLIKRFYGESTNVGINHSGNQKTWEATNVESSKRGNQQ